MSAWAYFAVPVVCLFVAGGIVGWALARAAALGDERIDSPRATDRRDAPHMPGAAHRSLAAAPGGGADSALLDWDAEAELAGLMWERPQ